MNYKAFISYSHAADNNLAPSLQSALHRFAKPFYRLRAMRTFRDKSNLSSTPKLWPVIQQALSESEFFILLASPESARSEWVQKEVDEWLRLNGESLDKFMVVLTDGELVWSEAEDDFDWSRTNALTTKLKCKFKSEPLYSDLRWAKHSEDLSLRNPQFLDEIGTLGATLHGKSKDLLVGQDVRQHRIFKLLTITTIFLLVFLSVGALSAAYYATRQKQEADRQRNAAVDQRREALHQTDLANEQKKEAEKQTAIAKKAADDEKTAKEGEQKARKIADEKRREADANAAEARRQLEHNRHLLYSANIGVTQQAYDSVDMGRMYQQLEQYAHGNRERDDFRGFEWYYLWNLGHRDAVTVRGHNGPIIAAAFSPAGDKLATVAEYDDSIIVWSLLTPSDIRTFQFPDLGTGTPEHGGASVAFSPDGSLLAVGGKGMVRIYDTVTTKEVRPPLTGHAGSVVSLAFAPDRQTLASGSDAIMLWDLKSGERRRTIPLGCNCLAASLAFSSDSTRLVAAANSGGVVKAWFLPEAGEAQLISHFRTVEEETGFYHQAVVFKSNDEIVVATGNGTVRSHSITTAVEKITNLKTASSCVDDKYIRAIALSPDATKVAGGFFDGKVELWNVETGEELNTFKGHIGRVDAIQFSPAGSMLVSGGYLPNKDVTSYPNEGEAKVWDVTTAPEAIVTRGETDDVSDTIQSLAFSPDDQKILGVGNTFFPMTVWDGMTGRKQKTLDDFRSKVIAYSPREHSIALVKGGEVLIIDPKDYSERFRLKDPDDPRGRDTIHSLAYSRDGLWLAAGTFEGGVKVWDVTRRLKFATLKIESDSYEANVIDAVAFLRDKNMLVAGNDLGTVTLWDVRRQARIRTLAQHQKFIESISVSPDGSMVATAGFEGSVMLSLLGSHSVTELHGHLGPVRSVIFSPDGKTFASGGDDGTVRLWNSFTGQQVLVFRTPEIRGPSAVSSVAFSHDGGRLAAGTGSGSLFIWDGGKERQNPIVSHPTLKR